MLGPHVQPATSAVNLRVLERIERSQAQITLLIAPAGYGKTSAAHKFSEHFERAAWCDCSGVAGAKSLMTRVIDGLARLCEGDDEIARARVQISSSDDEPEMLETLERAWTRSTGRGLLIFENCEELVGHPAMTDVLHRLLVTAPKDRRLILCSRVPLPIRAGRHLVPQRLLKVNASEFALTDDEARQLLAEEQLPYEHVERIIPVARGWPVVLLLFARLAREDQLTAALDIRSLAFEDLFTYFLHEVLAPLDERARRFLMLCSAVPNCSEEELAHVLEVPVLELRSLASGLPLLREHNGEFAVHPLVRNIVLQDDDTWKNAVRTVAEYHAGAGKYSRAARLYREIEDEPEAARALASLPTGELPLPQNLVELSHLSLATITNHPQLAIAALFSAAIVRNGADARRVLAALESFFFGLDPQTEPDVVASIAYPLASGLWFWGFPERHNAVITDPRTVRALNSRSSTARLFLVGAAEIAQAFGGKIESSYPVLRAVFDETQSNGMLARAPGLAYAIASIHRWRGDRQASQEWFERAISVATIVGSPLGLLGCVLGAAANAWFWDGDEGISRYHEHLSSCSIQIGARIDLWSVDVDPETTDITLDKIPLPMGPGIDLLLMKIARAPVSERPALFAKIDPALSRANPLTQISVLLARAGADPIHEREYLEQAQSRADATEAAAFSSAIRELRAGRSSFLAPLMDRFAPQSATSAPANVRLELLSGRLTIGGQAVPLTRREVSLLAYVARRRTPSTRGEIQETVWPDLDERGARDSLYSLVHRLRKRLVGADVIRSAGNAYAVADGVRVDLWEIEDLAGEVMRGNPLPSDVVRAAYDAVRNRSWLHLATHEWFALVDFNVSECQRQFVKCLIERALNAGRYDDALVYGQDIVAADECDEWGYKTVIKSYLALGRQLDAARMYKAYRAILQRELSAEPSEEMSAFAKAAGL